MAAIAVASARPAAAQVTASDAGPALAEDSAAAAAETGVPGPSTAAADWRVGPLQLDRLPVMTIADALRVVPGFTVVDFDGLGLDPRPVVRGRYGDGGTGELLVTFDGVPINDPESGSVPWDLLPPIAVDAVEVLRGGASWMHGEPSSAGVVDLVTVRDADPRGRWELAVGEHRTLRGGFSDESTLAGRHVRLFAGALRTEGFRDNAVRTGGTIGLSADLASGERRRLRASGLWMRRDAGFPGPVPASALPEGRDRIEPFFRFDGEKEWMARGALDGGMAVGSSSDALLTGGLSVEVRRSNDARTLLVGDERADTEERLLETLRFRAATELEMEDVALPWGDRLVAGLEASTTRLDSEFYHILGGDRTRYATAIITLFGRGVRDSLAASGDGVRHAAAAFAAYETTPAPWLRLSAGARLQWLRDGFEPDPAPGAGAGGVAAGDVDHVALSPRVGLGVRWIETDLQTGHLFATLGRSFQAPSPDQLFSQRSVPRPEPPFDGPVSDPGLEPRHATTLEAGAHHRLGRGEDAPGARLSLVPTRRTWRTSCVSTSRPRAG